MVAQAPVFSIIKQLSVAAVALLITRSQLLPSSWVVLLCVPLPACFTSEAINHESHHLGTWACDGPKAVGSFSFTRGDTEALWKTTALQEAEGCGMCPSAVTHPLNLGLLVSPEKWSGC